VGGQRQKGDGNPKGQTCSPVHAQGLLSSLTMGDARGGNLRECGASQDWLIRFL
jgi:hypothetical protein